MHLNGCPHGHSSALGNKNTEHKPDARAFGAGGAKKIMRAADNLTGKSVITGFWAGILFAAAQRSKFQ